ncbi:MAG: hypothetical protein LWW79_07835 [Holophagaceae bacterium]|nr:hypothetical protein [Holophagaceae bacterium]
MKVQGVVASFSLVSTSGSGSTIKVTIPPGLTNGVGSVVMKAGTKAYKNDQALYIRGVSIRGVEGRSWDAPFLPTQLNIGTPSDNSVVPRLYCVDDGPVLAIWQGLLGRDGVLWASFRTQAQGWSAPQMLVDRKAQIGSNSFAAAVNAAGQAVVIFNSGLGGVEVVNYDPGQGWTDPRVLTASPGLFGRLGAAINEKGDSLVMWSVYSDGVKVLTARYSKLSGWGLAETLNSGLTEYGGASPGSLASTGDGRVLATWCEYMNKIPAPANQTVWTREYDWATGWGEAVLHVSGQVVELSSMQAAGDGQGRRLLAWLGGPDSNHLGLVASLYTPSAGWLTPGPLAPSLGYDLLIGSQLDYYGQNALHLKMNAAGQAILGWTSLKGAQALEFDFDMQFGPVLDLVGPGTTGGNAFSNVDINSRGDRAAVWEGFSRKTVDGYLPDLVGSFKAAGGGWEAPRRIDATNFEYVVSTNPQVVLDSQGQVVSVWKHSMYGSQSGIPDSGFMSNQRNSQGIWGSPQLIANSPFGQSFRPSLQVDLDGGFRAVVNQTERRFQTPWGFYLPGPSNVQTDSLAPPQIGINLTRLQYPCPFDDFPTGNSSSPQISPNFAAASSSSHAMVGAWLANDGQNWQMCSGLGAPGGSFYLPGKGLNAAGTDADQPQLVSLGGSAKLNHDAPLVLWRQSTNGSNHEIWSNIDGYQWSQPPRPKQMLSAPGVDVDGLALASDNDVNAQAIWQQLGAAGWELWSAEFSLSSWWSPATRFGPATVPAARPKIVYTPAGFRLAVWLAGPALADLWGSVYAPPTGWGPAVLLGQGLTVAPEFHISSDGDRSFSLAWVSYGTGNSQMWGRVYRFATGWGSAIAVSGGGAVVSNPVAGVGESGNVVFAWIQSGQVMAALYHGTLGLFPTRLLSTGMGGCTDLDLRMAPSGHALAMWGQVEGGVSLVRGSYYY